MKTNLIILLGLGTCVCACATQPPEPAISPSDYKRMSDGVSVGSTPEIIAQFQRDLEQCKTSAKKHLGGSGGPEMPGGAGSPPRGGGTGMGGEIPDMSGSPMGGGPGRSGPRGFMLDKCLGDYGYIRERAPNGPPSARPAKL